METNLSRQENTAENESNAIECLKRQDHHPIVDAQKKPFLAGHVLLNPDCSPTCNGLGHIIQVGCLYEIDHEKLPPKSPIHLKAIRAVMVTEKTEHNVSVRFPSTLSLRTYFMRVSGEEMDQNLAGKMHPALDEQFVMRSNLAGKVLVRQIPSPEFAAEKNLQSFWLESPKAIEIPISVTKEGSRDDSLIKGMCWSSLRCAGLVHWGVRRRVNFIGRHREKTPVGPSSWCVMEEEDAVKTDANANAKEETKKGTHEISSHNRKAKSAKREKKKANTCKNNNNNNKNNNKNRSREKLKLSYDRWSNERYKTAEVKMLEIMKEKGAVFGKPMLRQMLRMEARKHIGDTGLLDHLLKHMAGKVAPDGKERFRRRHNADGAMEYWLESADLVNVRKEAGVKDPYWNPPPGWKLGDSPSQDPICARDLKLLKEEMANIKRDVKELLSLNEAPAKSVSNNSKLESDTTVVPLQEMYQSLVKRKSQLEQQLAEISNSLNGMQEEMRRLTSTVEESAKSAEVEVGAGKDKRGRSEEEKEEAAAAAAEEEAKAKAAKRQRLRSGFRICKPQGTFLWPNMGGSAGCSNKLSPHQVVVQVEDLLMVPTPNSVSSATSAPPRLLAAPQPTSPVKPLAERRAVTVTVSSVVIPEFACEGDNSSTSHHHQNDEENNQHDQHNNGFCGTPTSSSGYQRTLVLPHHVSCGGENEVRLEAVGSSTTVTSRTEMIQYQRKQQVEEGRDTYGGGRWLALATPNPALL